MSSLSLESLKDLLRPADKFIASLGLSTPELIVVAVILLFVTVPWVRIFRKAGYSPAFGFLMFVPPVNIFMFLLFAYNDWPIERNHRAQNTQVHWRR